MALSSVIPTVPPSPRDNEVGDDFLCETPTLGDIDLSNRPRGSGWGTEWEILVTPLNSYVNTIQHPPKSLLRVILCLLSQRKQFRGNPKNQTFLTEERGN